MFRKKKENIEEVNTNTAGKDKNKNITANAEDPVDTSANKVFEGFHYLSANVHLPDENTDTFSRNTIAGSTTKTGGFNFVKKVKPKNEAETFSEAHLNTLEHKNESTTAIQEENNQQGNISFPPKIENNENKTSKGGFKFIKKTIQASIDLNKSENNQSNLNEGNQSDLSNINISNAGITKNIITPSNNYNTNANISSNKLTLDNLLSESENILNIIQKDIDNSYISAKNNMSDIQQETTSIPTEGM